MLGDYFFQIVLFLAGVALGFWGQLTKSDANIKRTTIACSVLIIIISIFWAGYELGRKETTASVPPTSLPDRNGVSQLNTPAIQGAISTESKKLEENSLVTATITISPSSTPTIDTSILPTALLKATPDPRLFWDNFDSGIRPEWQMSGNNFAMINGQLSSQGIFTAHIGDTKWEDYAVEFDLPAISNSEFGFKILIRQQSDSEYMSFQLNTINNCYYRWTIVENGNEKMVTGSQLGIYQDCMGHYRIEAHGNTYKFFKEGKQVVYFTNDKIKYGNVGIIGVDNNSWILDNFEILALE